MFQVLLAPSELSAPNYVSQLLESEGKFPTAPAVPSVEWRREEEQREYERERREAEARIEVSRKEREETSAFVETLRKEAKERGEVPIEDKWEEWNEKRGPLPDISDPHHMREFIKRQKEFRAEQEEEQAELLAAGRQAAREEHEAQRLEEADERNELFPDAQAALVREVLSCAVEAAFVDQSQQGYEPHKEQLLAEVQRDFGPDATWEEVYVCIENCNWSDPDDSYLFAVEEHAYAFLEEVGVRFGSTDVWGSTDLDLLASGYGGHSDNPVSVAQIAKAIASHMPLADLADIARSESEQGTTE